MGIVNFVFGGIFDVLLYPFRGLSPWFGMIFVSLVTAFLMLWVFKLTSDQEGIRKSKNAIKAHLMELRLFKDNMRISLQAQGRILRANMRYIACNSRPMLIMFIPLLLILAQLNLWFGAAPLKPGEETLVKLGLARGTDPLALDVAIEPSPGLSVESPAVRIPDEHEIAWRIRATGRGPASLTFRVAGRTLTKPLAVAGPRLSKISTLTVGSSLLKQVLYPGEKSLPGDTPVTSIEVLYPGRSLGFFGLSVHWLVAYFALSIIFGFAFKGVFKVEI
ncbi:MAG: hypothetical protein ABSG73_01825 [Candidatus Aminicenantales bacterium]|jgi:uncharacterized membrane protein (DUF106 family)